MGRRAKFKKSSSFKDLLERRKAAGLTDLSPGDVDNSDAMSNDMLDAEMNGDGELDFDDDALNDKVECDAEPVDLRKTPMLKDFPDKGEDPESTPGYPAVGDRSLPMFRDFNMKRERKLSDDLGLDNDIHGENLHDHARETGYSLPSAEELKIALQSNSAKTWLLRRRCSKWCWIVAALVIISLFITTVSLKAEVESSSNITSGTKIVTDNDPNSVDRMVKFLIDHGASAEIKFAIREHPQRRAAMYMAAGDGYSSGWIDNSKMTQRLIERYSLALLYYGMRGELWLHRLKFLSSIDHCHWFTDMLTTAGNRIRMGVACNDDGLVTNINLGYNNVNGFETEVLPVEIGNFENLESLHLHNNLIHGKIPQSLGKLKKLKSLSLQYNHLHGSIPPSIGDLTQLTALGLGSNGLKGEIPSAISKLSNLRLLGLDSNEHLKGDLGALFGKMKDLRFLYLDNNMIDGEINNELVTAWENMMELDLSHNLIDGQISKEIMNMPNLLVLDLSINIIDGSFPDDILENTKLEYLALHRNRMTGAVSDRLGFLRNLKHLDVSLNKFTGTLPDVFGMMTHLKYLASAGNNFLEQNIMDLSELKNLESLSFKGNNMTGTIPEFFTELANLEILDLDANQLTGSIPSRIGFMENLKFLLLNRNRLSGTIPNSMSLMGGLEMLLLDGNNIKGTAQVICESKVKKPGVFSSDCYPTESGSPPEIECRCCSICCLDSDPRCNNLQYTSNFDPSWEYGYVRPSYMFNIENAPEEFAKDQGGKEFIMDQIP